MRLIIPHAYNVPGGVERVTVSLIREFEKLIDSIIFVLPEKNRDYFQEIIPSSKKIIYESFKIGQKERNNELRCLIKKHHATHCLYMITGGQPVPKISIPLAVILYDVYWHFAPQRYAEEFRKKRDKNLKEWLQKASIAFSISGSTKADIDKFFFQFKNKIKVIPLAADVNYESLQTKELSIAKGEAPIFFYPASHAGYQKNFLTLFRTVHTLATKGLNFKVVISGRETEKLIGDGSFSGNQDEEARLFYQKKKDVLSKHIETLGFCSRERIEDLYNKCRCVVLPSRYEGFGLPLIEALSRGCYAICSDIPTHQEQIALYDCSDMVKIFVPDDTERLAQLMEETIIDPKKRVPQEEIKKRFSHRTWKQVAKEHINCLESVA